MRISSLPTSRSSTRRRSSILGNDDFLLTLLRKQESAAAVRDYVGWTLDVTRALGIKVVNAGGAMAFKSNVRVFLI